MMRYALASKEASQIKFHTDLYLEALCVKISFEK